jgi:lantibiotic biosynthesis protein
VLEPWDPLLDQSRLGPARVLVSRICRNILSKDALFCDSADFASRALLLTYASRSDLDIPLGNKAQEYADLAGERMSSAMPIALHGGMCGAAWMLRHMSNPWWAPHNPENPLSEVDEFLVSHILQEAPSLRLFDLIDGIVGVGIYLLEHPVDSNLKALRWIVHYLYDTREEVSTGYRWLTPPELLPDHQRSKLSKGYYNLGLAHGLAGIIHFLAEAVHAKIETETASSLLEGAISWLLSCRNKSVVGPSIFPNWVTPEGKSTSSRIAWCYGDLGIGSVLLRVSLRLKRSDWESAAHEILNRCVERSSERDCNAALCHGAFGISHIYNRLYHTVRLEPLRTCAVEYLELGLQIVDAAGAGEEKRSSPQMTMPGYKLDPFLEGDVGIALALLSATSPLLPAWDRMLGLSGHGS